MQTSVGVVEQAFMWFLSHFSVQYVQLSDDESSPHMIRSGIDQGSAVGSISFLLYAADLATVVQRHKSRPHLYAYDIQIYGSAKPTEVVKLQRPLSACMDHLVSWMTVNSLMLNAANDSYVLCPSLCATVGTVHVPAISMVPDY